MHLFNLCWLMVIIGKELESINWQPSLHCCGPLACSGITVALIGLSIIPVNPFACFECWHICPIWCFIAFQDLGKALLMLQTISQELSKNSWMRLSHSYSLTVQLLPQWLLISELLLKEHLSGPAWIHSCNTTQLRWDLPFVSVADSSPPRISLLP